MMDCARWMGNGCNRDDDDEAATAAMRDNGVTHVAIVLIMLVVATGRLHRVAT